MTSLTFNAGDQKSPKYGLGNKLIFYFHRAGYISNKYFDKEHISSLRREKSFQKDTSFLGVKNEGTGLTSIRRPLRDGYLYMITEKAKPVISEYEIVAGNISPILEESKFVSKDVRKVREQIHQNFIFVDDTYKAFFAFSPMQWSADYMNQCLSNKKNLRKRFQEFDVNTRVYGNTDWCRHWEIDVGCPILKEQDQLLDISQTYKKEHVALDNLRREFELVEKSVNPKSLFFHFTIHDPLGCASDICYSLMEQYEYHDNFTTGLAVGRSSELMKRSSDVDWNDYSTQQFHALYTSGNIIYQMINEGIDKANRTKTILEKMLGINERKESLKLIRTYRECLANHLRTNHYQNAFLDAFYNVAPRIADGYMIGFYHLRCLNIEPSSKDPLYSPLLDEEEYDEHIKESLSEPTGNAPECAEKNAPFQNVFRELQGNEKLLNSYVRAYSKMINKNDLAEPITVTVDKILTNLDTYLSFYCFGVKNKLDALRLQEVTNRTLAYDGSTAVLTDAHMKINLLSDEALLNTNNKKSVRRFLRKSLGLDEGQRATKTQLEVIKKWEEQLYKKSQSEIVETYKPSDGRRKLGKMFRKVRKITTDDIKRSSLLKVKDIRTQLKNSNELVVLNIKKLEEGKVYSIFKRSRVWTSTVGVFSVMNLYFATNRAIKEKSFISNMNLIFAVIELSSVGMSVYASFTGKAVGEKFLRMMGWNVNFALAARLGIISGFAGGIISIYDGLDEISKRNEEAGAAFVASGILTMGSSAAFWAGFAGVVGASALAGPMAVLAIALLILGVAISKTDFEKFIAAGVFRGREITGLVNMEPLILMHKLFEYRSESIDFEGDNGRLYDLKDFKQMLNYLYDQIYHIETIFEVDNSRYLSWCRIKSYTNFYITCNMPQIPKGAYIEYCMQVIFYDMNDVVEKLKDRNQQSLFTSLKRIFDTAPNDSFSKEMQELKPIKIDFNERWDENKKNLKGYTAKFEYDISEILKNNRKIAEENIHTIASVNLTSYNSWERTLAQISCEVDFVFALRIVLDSSKIYTSPVSINGAAEYYVLTAERYTFGEDDPMDGSRWFSVKNDYMLGSDLQINPIIFTIEEENEDFDEENYLP